MRRLLFAAVLALSTFTGCAKDKGDAAAEKKADELPAMSLDQVEQGIAAKEVVALDCNGDKTRKKYGVVPGAILIADEEAFGASELPADKNAKLVFYCSGPG